MDIDRQMLNRVANDLCLTRPVDIQWMPLPPGIHGQYDPHTVDRHLIRLTDRPPGCCAKHARLTARSLTETLLHELRHAAQAEGLPDLVGAYELFDQRVGYRDNPLEQDAQDFADRNAGRFAGLVYGPDLVTSIEPTGVPDWMRTIRDWLDYSGWQA